MFTKNITRVIQTESKKPVNLYHVTLTNISGTRELSVREVQHHTLLDRTVYTSLETVLWKWCHALSADLTGTLKLRASRGRCCSVAWTIPPGRYQMKTGPRCKYWQRSAAALTHLISAITQHGAACVELWRWNSSVALSGVPYANNIICKTHNFFPSPRTICSRMRF